MGLDSPRCNMYGLQRSMVDPRFREPFIMEGYRKPGINAMDCFKSVFVFYCNETINVWSHFIAFVLFAIKFTKIFVFELSITDPFNWPLLVYSIGICGFCLMSSVAHMFNSVSSTVRHTCFFMDYAAITIYSVGAGQAFWWYTRPIQTDLLIFNHPVIFGTLSLFISILCTHLCCSTRMKWHKNKYAIRTGTMVIPFLVNAFPYIYRMNTCTNSVDCDQSSQWMFRKHVVLFLIGAFANVARFPERFMVGVFDYCGHSHHFLHVFTALGSLDQFDGIRLDIAAREDQLRQSMFESGFWNSTIFFVFAFLVNWTLALWFGKKMADPNFKYDKNK